MYPDDNLHELYDNWETMVQIYGLEKYFLNHLFCRKIDQEKEYFEAPEWSTRALRVALAYALQMVELTVNHYRETILNSKTKPSEAKEEKGLLDFVQPNEAIPAPLSTPKLLDQLRDSDVEKVVIDQETASAIAFLGIIKTRVLKQCGRDHRGSIEVPEAERREQLRAWLECPERVGYTLPRVPVKLLQPQFTRQDLNWAAIHVKWKRQHHKTGYRCMWQTIKLLGMTDKLEAKRCVPYDDLYKVIRIHRDLVNFDLYPDKYILNNRWTSDDFNFDIETGEKLEFQEPNDQYEIEMKRIHRNARWSIAEYAKQAKCV
jgi:hypothetical protein